MRRPFFFGASASARPALAFVLACTFVTGCGLIKKKGAGDDDEPPANAPTVTVTVTGTGAKNEKDILRYASETKIADEPATIGKDATKVKTFPASGADVTALAKGTAVVKIAKFFSTGVLVIFDDPATADGSKLMGWITPEALAAPSATTTAAPVFTAPKVAAVDAGAKDAGAAVDAGGAADAGKVADAGGPIQSSGTITTLPIGGKCPAGMILVAPLCRKPCAADGDCPRGSTCKSAGGRKTCGI